jgi:hypothetical protein
MADLQWKSIGYDKGLLPLKAIEVLDSGLATVVTALNSLQSLINLVQLFINAFGSLMGVINAFISLVQGQLKSLSDSLGNAGVFVNVVVPQAFMRNFSISKLSTGGFEGFLQRLKVSFYNDADKNRPVFKGPDALVGGLILAADTETLDDFFKAMNFIAGLFNFMDLFPFNTAPPPPRNVRAYTGWFKQTDGSTKYGIKVLWDAPNLIPPMYRVTRSRIDGGVITVSSSLPKRLIGPPGHKEQGLLTAFPIALSTGKFPKVITYEYLDPLDKNIIVADLVTGGGGYIDYSIEQDAEATYYYVVESGFGIMWGPKSPQLIVQAIPAHCINKDKMGVVLNNYNQVEFLSKGVGALGQWTSIRINVILPFLPMIVNTINNLLEILKGSLKTNTKAFIEFLKGMIDKFKKYEEYLEAIITMITSLENFFTSAPKIMALTIPPSTGGVDTFVNKFMGAKKPVGASGKGGMTVGVCFVYGSTYNNPLKTEDAPSIDSQMQAIAKAFAIISKILKQG